MLQTWTQTVSDTLEKFLNQKHKRKHLSDICWESITPDLESNVRYGIEGTRLPANAAWMREKALIEKEADENPWSLSDETDQKETLALKECIHTLLFHDTISLAAKAGIDIEDEVLFDAYLPPSRSTKKALARHPFSQAPKYHCPKPPKASALQTN